MSNQTDRLAEINSVAREVRGLRLEASDLDSKLRRVKERLRGAEMEQLPALFSACGIDELGLPAEGNMPAMDFELKPFFRANIAADWEPDRRQQAFDYLEQNGAGDLIKGEIVIILPRGSEKLRQQITNALSKMKVDFHSHLMVPWNTLTAWLRESVDKGDLPELDKIGGSMGQVVRVKERKD